MAESTRRKRHGEASGPPGLHAVEKPKDTKFAVKSLFGYLGVYKIPLAIMLGVSVVSMVFAVLGPEISSRATTELFNGIMSKISGTGGGIDFGRIAEILLTVFALYLISAILSLVSGLITAKIANTVTYKLRRDVDDKIHKLPFSYFDKTLQGDTLSVITNDIDTINTSLNQTLTQVITSITLIVGFLVMMFSISWQMTVIAMLTLPLSFGVIAGIFKGSQKHFKGQQKYLAEVNGIVEENYGAHTVVKAFRGEKQAIESFEKSNEKLYKSGWKANFFSSLMMPIMTTISNIGYVAVCILGGALAAKGRLDVGNIQAFIQYMRQFTNPIMQLSQVSNQLQSTLAASERVFNFLSETEELADSENAKVAEKIKGNVKFKNVKFGYLPEKTIIKDFSTNVKAGQKIAIVGPTGAGKTTIIKLLMRFYELDKGAISIDGTKLTEYTRSSIRTAFGMVLQDTWCFNGTVFDNIAYGRLDADRDEVIAAAKTAGAHHFIKQMPQGYDTILNEETSNLSEGQKQLLTIARAVLANPSILILDEATSSVDTRTERKLQAAMDNLMKGRTSFVIAHRLSTIREADMILYMGWNGLEEKGNHKELLALNGKYAELWNSQFAV